VASRWWCLPTDLADAIRRSTSSGVKCSLDLTSVFFRRGGGETFPFLMFGAARFLPLKRTTLLTWLMLTLPLMIGIGKVYTSRIRIANGLLDVCFRVPPCRATTILRSLPAKMQIRRHTMRIRYCCLFSYVMLFVLSGCSCMPNKTITSVSADVGGAFTSFSACQAHITATGHGGCVVGDPNVSAVLTTQATSCTTYCSTPVGFLKKACTGTQSLSSPGGPVCVLNPDTDRHFIRCTPITSFCTCT